MRSLDHRFRPPSRPPVSDRELARYAGKWVLVRAGKVVLQASSYDALMSALTSKRVRDTDAIYKLPVRSSGPTERRPHFGPHGPAHSRPARSPPTGREDLLRNHSQSASSAS